MLIKIPEETYQELLEMAFYAEALLMGSISEQTWRNTAIQDFIQAKVESDKYLEEYLRNKNLITEDGILDKVTIEEIAKYYTKITVENQEEENAST